ncbi:MAG: ABC transporter substrate-binding protein [Anaerolineales bacterium]|nr:ABC transporter substrate-binding protein [Anaerolineales bacterium]
MLPRLFRGVSVLAAVLVVAACAGATPAPAAPVTVRFAMLPILDALPMFVAQDKGYFAAEGIDLQVVPAASAAARDQLMQAGQGDAMVNDLVSTLFYNKDAVTLKVVRYARTATADFAQYFILAGPGTGITDAAGLKGVDIAISEATTIQYVTDRLLAAEGLTPEDIRTVAIPNIVDRMTALANGGVPAAAMPDPAAASAIASGARIVVSDAAHPELGHSELSFSAAFVAAHPEAVRGFLRAWEKAVADINADKTAWNSLLAANKLLSDQLIDSYLLPDYPTAAVPTEAQFRDVNDWAKERGLINKDLSYADSVDSSFLPK